VPVVVVGELHVDEGELAHAKTRAPVVDHGGQETAVLPAIAAIVLPYKKKELFEASPIAQMKVAGIPLITIAGVIFGGFLLFLLVEWFFDPWLNPAFAPAGLYGISLANTNSVIFLLVCYGSAAALYYGFKSYRKKGGIDMDKVQTEIPVE